MQSSIIQYATNTWLAMRENPMNPKGVIERITDTTGDARYLLLLMWALNPDDRRMVSIHASLTEASDAVLWQTAADRIDSNGYPPGRPQRVAVDRAQQTRKCPLQRPEGHHRGHVRNGGRTKSILKD